MLHFIGLSMLFLVAVFLLWCVFVVGKEKYEQLRARILGYRVKVVSEGYTGDCSVVYIVGDTERKFDVDCTNGKQVINLSMPYVGTYSSLDGYWEIMRNRIIKDVKRLKGNRIKVITNYD